MFGRFAGGSAANVAADSTMNDNTRLNMFRYRSNIILHFLLFQLHARAVSRAFRLATT